MSYCLSPNCSQPQNPEAHRFCQTCGAPLLLNGRYRALKPLSPGGFSRTFLAVDEGTGRQVCVIKQLHCTNGNADFQKKVVELFEREAQRLEDLGPHSQIPDFFAHFEQDGRHYIAQEFVDGQTLEEELEKKGAFQEPQIWQLLKDILPLLHFIHQHQVIHRDIKPANLIRRYSDGKLMLIDFGAAKVVTEAKPQQPGTNIGTTGYAAPEQLRGQPLFASDLYSLGVTCIHLLTQMEPFDLYDAHQSAFVWQDFLVNNPVSSELSQILNKLVRVTANERYPSALSVMAALGRSAVSHPTNINANSPLSSPLSPSFSAKGASSGSIQTGISSRAIAQSSTISVTPIHTAPGICYNKLRQVAILNNGQGAIWSVAFSPDGLLLVSGSGGISRLGFINGSEDSTVRLWTLDPQPKVKDFWSHGDRVRAVSFSPDEHRVASVGEDRTVHLYHLLTRSHRVSKGHLETLHFLAFSPDGQTIAVGSGGYDAETTSQGKVILWQVQTGRIVQFMFAGTIVNVPVAFSPDGRLLAFPINLLLKGENCSVIKLLRLQTQKAYYLHPPKRLQPSYHPFYSVAFSPDGKRLASSNALGIQIWDVENRKLLWQVNPGNPWGQHNPIVFSPNGEVLACIRAGRLSLWDVHAQVPKPILLLGAGFLSVAFSPDGRAIAAGRKDGTIHLWQCDA